MKRMSLGAREGAILNALFASSDVVVKLAPGQSRSLERKGLIVCRQTFTANNGRVVSTYWALTELGRAVASGRAEGVRTTEPWGGWKSK